MTILTRRTAELERVRLLSEVRFHRHEAARAKRALDRLEADCARVGIRLIRVRPTGRDHATPTNPDDR
jgi:hypothetical protein